jgi:hypothetical protein
MISIMMNKCGASIEVARTIKLTGNNEWLYADETDSVVALQMLY